MSINLNKIFSYCAVLAAVILIFSLLYNKYDGESIDVSRTASNQPGNTIAADIHPTEIAIANSHNFSVNKDSSNNNSNKYNSGNNFSNNNNSSIAYEVEYVDITQNYIPPISSAPQNPNTGNEPTPTPFASPAPQNPNTGNEPVFKTPNINLSYSNDCVNVSISEVPIKSFKLYRAVNDEGFSEIKFISGNSYKDSAVGDGNTYSYKALCTKTDGTSVYTYTNKISIDKLALISIVNVKCGINEITLSWNSISGAKYYDIYRMEDGSYKKIKSINISSFTDSGLNTNTEYSYKIYARDANGNKISISQSLNYKTLYLPPAPTLELYSNDEYGIQIAWSVSKDALSYNVYKYIGGNFVLVKNTKNNYYIDKTASGTCTYAVSAIGSSGEGEKSITISVTAVK